jgi:hypothetical protein
MTSIYETGTCVIGENDINKEVFFSKTYTIIPVIKITTNKNINIFITNVSEKKFTIEKSELEEATIYYSVIGS